MAHVNEPGTGEPDDIEPNDSGKSVSLRELVAEATRRLAASHVEDGPRIDNAAAEARWMMEQASGYEGGDYVSALDTPATVRMVHAFDAMLARRLAGEPLQYVLGRWAFRHLDVMVDRRVLIPRPETEQVVEVALDELRRMGAQDRSTNVVDLGTGSGVIALSVAMEVALAQVWAVECSPEALEVARANLAGLGRPAARVRLLEGDWFEALPEALRGSVDLIVANPPYVAEHERPKLPTDVVGWEPMGALISGPSGLEDLQHIVAVSPRWLAPDGALVVECAPHQTEKVAALAKEAGFGYVSIFNDLAGRGRGVLGCGTA